MKRLKKVLLLLGVATMIFGVATTVSAQSKDKIKNGVTIDGEDVGGLTSKQAKKAVREAVEKKEDIHINIKIGDKTCKTTLRELGYKWSNEDIVYEAMSFGKSGSIIKRYIDNKDLEHKGINYKIKMAFDKKEIKKDFKNIAEDYNVPVKNPSLKATGHGFKIIEGEQGTDVDVEKTLAKFKKYVKSSWDKKSDIDFEAVTKVAEPKYTEEDCKKVSDTPMGSFTTYVSGGPANEQRNKNIANGVEKLDDHTIYPGESFSCNEQLEPWTEDNGWHPAGTYVEGEVQDSLGGGICQVSTTLYNALLRAEIKITERHDHSMAVGYVDLGADAALAGDYKDLVFYNDTDAPIYIQGKYNGGTITFNVYGHDTRKAGHKVEFVSEKVKDIPIKKQVIKDPSQPSGYMEVKDEGHEGHVAKFFKITYEDGKEVSKELLHTSKYAMAPKKIIKGTGGSKKTEEATKMDDNEKETEEKPAETEKKKHEEE